MADVGTPPNWEQRDGPGRPAGETALANFTATPQLNSESQKFWPLETGSGENKQVWTEGESTTAPANVWAEPQVEACSATMWVQLNERVG